MENIERTQFVVLTGHLDDQPLPDLIRTLRVQRKSGRLQVEYADAPGSFFFEEGQLVDAQLGSLRGLEALYAALALDGAAFNFNPLVRPPERSIDRQQQKFITDLVEIPRRENLAEIKIAGGGFPAKAFADATQQAAPLQLAPVAAELIAPLEQRLTAVEQAINTTSRRFSRERLIYAIVISFLVGLTVVTALQALLSLRRPPASTTPGATAAGQKLDALRNARPTARGEALHAGDTNAPANGATAAAQSSDALKNLKPAAAVVTATKQTASPKAVAGTRDAQGSADAPTRKKSDGGYLLHVRLDVRKGEVIRARVLNPRPGMDDYDARAIQLARQRRYPSTFNGSDTVMIKVWF